MDDRNETDQRLKQLQAELEKTGQEIREMTAKIKHKNQTMVARMHRDWCEIQGRPWLEVVRE